MRKKSKYLLPILFMLSASFSIFADDTAPQEDIHLEGVYTEIKPSDIGEDIFLWAQDTAKDLEDVLKSLTSKPARQQRKEILTVLHNATAQISGQRELLLMHYLINRAIALDQFFSNDSRAVNYILLPSLKKAIHFYKNTDLPFLEKNAGKPNATEILPPDYTVLIQEMLPMLLTASEMNGSTENRFEILRLALVWTILDLHNSAFKRRESPHAQIMKRLYPYYRDEIKDFEAENATFQLNNEIRGKLHQALLEIDKRHPEVVIPRLDRGTSEGSRRDSSGDRPQNDMHPPQNDTIVVTHHALLGKFSVIPAGEFMMGSPPSEANQDRNESQHLVTLTQSFEIMQTEVTQRMWVAVMDDENPSYFGKHLQRENLPVERVSWNDIQLFMDRLNRSTNDGYTYRLPTEAEWEYAARAGTKTAYSFGNNPMIHEKYAWSRENAEGKTHVVGSLLPNDWGLYDIHGNVWEWVLDPYSSDYSKAVSQEDANRGNYGSGSYRVIRGGGWYDGAQVLRSAGRGILAPDGRYCLVGFRLVRTKK